MFWLAVCVCVSFLLLSSQTFSTGCVAYVVFARTSRLLLNEGHPEAKPTVVLGISGKPEKMCNLELVRRDKVRE